VLLANGREHRACRVERLLLELDIGQLTSGAAALSISFVAVAGNNNYNRPFQVLPLPPVRALSPV